MSRASAERRSRAERDPGPEREKSRSALWLPVAIRRVALGPGSRCARPGHERAQSRRAKRTVARAAFTMSNSAVLFVPAVHLCARVLAFPFASTATRGGRSADRRTMSVVARVRRDHSAPRRGAARPMTRDARLSALHRGDFRPGPRFHLRHCLRIRAASSSQPGRRAWRAVSRTSRVRGYEPRPQDATPRSAFRIVSGDAPHERGWRTPYYRPVT